MLRSSILLLSLLVLNGCNSTDNDAKDDRTIEPNFKVIKSSSYPSDYIEYSQGNASILAYHSDDGEDVNAFNAQYQLLTNDTPPEFDGNMIIAKSGTKGTGGYEISVEKVEDIGQYTQVTIKNKKAGKGCLVTMALTNPYTIVLIPEDHKEVKFIENNVTIDCEGDL